MRPPPLGYVPKCTAERARREPRSKRDTNTDRVATTELGPHQGRRVPAMKWKSIEVSGPLGPRFVSEVQYMSVRSAVSEKRTQNAQRFLSLSARADTVEELHSILETEIDGEYIAIGDTVVQHRNENGEIVNVDVPAHLAWSRYGARAELARYAARAADLHDLAVPLRRGPARGVAIVICADGARDHVMVPLNFFDATPPANIPQALKRAA